MKIRVRLWVKVVIFIFALILLLFIYGRFINTNGFKVNEYFLKEDIPESFNGLKIVQLSDINYKHTTDKNELKSIVKRINLIDPDIVVFTGDLLNKSITYSQDDIKELTKLLSNINVKIGKFAVKGEEDKKFEFFDQIMEDSEFLTLNNSYELIYNKSNNPIFIAGISDINKNIDSIDNYLNNNDIYSILLIHKPDDIKNINYNNFNLILAGHSLNGYINIPYIKNLFLDNGCKTYYNNYYKLDNTKLYISNGIGTKNIKYRFLNKPSFNFFRIQKK